MVLVYALITLALRHTSVDLASATEYTVYGRPHRACCSTMPSPKVELNCRAEMAGREMRSRAVKATSMDVESIKTIIGPDTGETASCGG